ncbi:hypothetical protein EZV62_018106 [Acer yangbiense]|uniref:Protein kinase domain-containing protein n=1 Tax=Acer yangbiense TaxID=1000413 RepID=A0A5C7HID2_9ROSI|nr:hypothetical protein EZV62_018106 [Acer yangbiense]
MQGRGIGAPRVGGHKGWDQPSMTLSLLRFLWLGLEPLPTSLGGPVVFLWFLRHIAPGSSSSGVGSPKKVSAPLGGISWAREMKSDMILGIRTFGDLNWVGLALGVWVILEGSWDTCRLGCGLRRPLMLGRILLGTESLSDPDGAMVEVAQGRTGFLLGSDLWRIGFFKDQASGGPGSFWDQVSGGPGSSWDQALLSGENASSERYAAPEQYIMSTQTPSAPSAPVAAALSPVLWQLNLPDRFDIYSTGLIFLQMAFPGFRTDNGLIQFNRQLKRCDYDLNAWRKTVEPRAGVELRRGFELLDLDGGIGWELLTSMVRYKARQRVSAKAALAHPYFDREALLALSFMQNLRLQFFRATQQDYSEAANWIIQLMARSGTEKEGGFTEAQLQELRETEPKKKASPQRNALASALRLQRKIVRTLNESMDELNTRRKSLWWSRWIPKEE